MGTIVDIEYVHLLASVYFCLSIMTKRCKPEQHIQMSFLFVHFEQAKSLEMVSAGCHMIFK